VGASFQHAFDHGLAGLARGADDLGASTIAVLARDRANHHLAGRKPVERGRRLLQSERRMNERQAYEYLRRTSRQRRIPLA
jgi:hypothetical protein